MKQAGNIVLKKVFIINGHEPYDFSTGGLNQALIDRAEAHFSRHGYDIRFCKVTDDYVVEEQVKNHLWADYIFIQFPVNWMGVPWSMKKYMDLVYTAGIGELCDGDGRTREDPSKQYGSGGQLKGRKYLFSATFNAPKEAFNDVRQVFFKGKSVDDLFGWLHLNYEFLGMEALPTFACYDVMKNPQIESDFERFQHHLNRVFA
jgi:modulator of drug activity B